MEKIEIRHNKRKLILGIIILVFMTIGTNYMAFFTKAQATNQLLKIVVVPLSLFVLYGVYKQFKKVLEDKPVITLTKTYIEINEDGKPLTFSWTEIRDWRIEKKQSIKSETDILSIRSDTKSGEVNISTLEKSVDDIRRHINLLENTKRDNGTAANTVHVP